MLIKCCMMMMIKCNQTSAFLFIQHKQSIRKFKKKMILSVTKIVINVKDKNYDLSNEWHSILLLS